MLRIGSNPDETCHETMGLIDAMLDLIDRMSAPDFLGSKAKAKLKAAREAEEKRIKRLASAEDVEKEEKRRLEEKKKREAEMSRESLRKVRRFSLGIEMSLLALHVKHIHLYRRKKRSANARCENQG